MTEKSEEWTEIADDPLSSSSRPLPPCLLFIHLRLLFSSVPVSTLYCRQARRSCLLRSVIFFTLNVSSSSLLSKGSSSNSMKNTQRRKRKRKRAMEENRREREREKRTKRGNNEAKNWRKPRKETRKQHQKGCRQNSKAEKEKRR